MLFNEFPTALSRFLHPDWPAAGSPKTASTVRETAQPI